MRQTLRLSIAASLGIFLVPFLAGTVCGSEATVTYGFQGPVALSGNAGDWVSGHYFCTLTQAGVDPPTDPENPVATGFGTQGWSISLTAINAQIVSITTSGTDGARNSEGGLYRAAVDFEQTELTTKAKAGSECEGKDGAISGVALALTLPNTLPENKTYTIAKIGVAAAVPAGGGTATLEYVNGCQGAGTPKDNKVTMNQNSLVPVVISRDVELREIVTCCGKPLNFGFTSVPKDTAIPYDGIADDGAGMCLGSGGSIVTDVAEGATGEASVYVNISSELAAGGVGGVQGWTLAIAMNGDISFDPGYIVNNDPNDPASLANLKAAVTTAGTAARTYSGAMPFEETAFIVPEKNGGQMGAVAAYVLALTTKAELPVTGTASVLRLNVKANAAQGDADIVGELKLQDGLIGTEKPTKNAATVNTSIVRACDVENGSVAVDVIFRKKAPSKVSRFIRGEVNRDGKVNIADVVYIINALFRGGPPIACVAAAELDGKPQLTVGDALYLIRWQFLGGDRPPAPFPGCGLDPTVLPEECPVGSVPACP